MAIEREQAAEIIEAFVSLIRVSRTIVHRDAEHSVSGTPLAILRLIRDTDLRLGDLADQLRVKPSVASRAVATLENEGLVERSPDPDDARACRIQLTDAGRAQLSSREDHVVQLVAGAFADWSPEQVEQSVQMLYRLEEGVLDWIGVSEQEATSETQPNSTRADVDTADPGSRASKLPTTAPSAGPDSPPSSQSETHHGRARHDRQEHVSSSSQPTSPSLEETAS